MRTPALVLLSALALGPAQAMPQPGLQAQEAVQSRPSPEASLADLALAYLRFEQAFAANPPEGAELARIGRGFDAATGAYFNGGIGGTIRQIDALTESLLPRRAEGPPESARVVAQSISASARPAVFDRTSGGTPVIELKRLYELPPSLLVRDGGQPVRVEATIVSVDAPERPVAIVGFTLDGWPDLPDAEPLGVAMESLPTGAYEVRLAPLAGRPRVTARWYVVEGSRNALRRRLSTRLDEVEGESSGDDLESAIAVLRSRLDLLSDDPSTTHSAQFMADQAALGEVLERELEAIARGENPYRERPGDLWRTIRIADASFPARIYSPPRTAAQGSRQTPRPLVIALHGLGGDENMFMDAYGAGVLKQLADKHDLVVVSPRNNAFASNPLFFDGLVEAVSADYRIDPSRVYVIGHSMGAGVATAWTRARPDRLAAAAAIAGFPPARTAGEVRTAPTLLVAAEFDGIIPTDRVRPAAEAAIAAGQPIEFRILPNHGHTTVVGAALPEAIAWLLGHTLGDGCGAP